MKKKIVVKAPALSASGYGEQARFALRSLRQQEDSLEIFLININWGRTGQAPLEPEEKQWLEHLIAKTQAYAKQNNNRLHFDLSLQITIPNEFEKMADVNIGYTAGIETTKVAHQWIEKCNMMDKIIVPSNHSKNVLEQTVYKAKREGNEETFDFKLNTPVEVCAFPANTAASVIPELNLETEWNFLSVAQWGPRKNVEATVRNFLEEFKDDEDVGLVLKLNVAKNSMMDKLATQNRLRQVVDQVKSKIGQFKCKLYLLHGSLSDEEMRGLYRHPKIKAFVTTTHGEGFGLPMFDAAIAGLPITAPAWSSYVDFLYAPKRDKKTGKEKNFAHFVKIDYELKPVQKEAVWDGVIVADSQWCWVKDYSVREAMRELRKNFGPHLSEAKKLSVRVLENFTEEKQNKKMIEFILNEVDFDSQITFINQEIKEEIKKISFCISTNGKKKDKTLKNISSIKQTMTNCLNTEYEIRICGDVENFKEIEDITLVDASKEASEGSLAKLRNLCAKEATGDVLVFIDDDIVFTKEWASKLLDYNKNNSWDVLGNKILLPNGDRYWDRATINPHVMIPYTESDKNTNLYQTGCFWIIRTKVWKKNPWDDSIGYYAERTGGINEDVEYSRRLRGLGYLLKFDRENLVWHWDDSYLEFEIGNNVSVCLKQNLIPDNMKKDFIYREDFNSLLDVL